MNNDQNGTTAFPPDQMWRLDSFEAVPANKDGFFPLEFNLVNIATGEQRKVVLAMSNPWFAQVIADLADLLDHQLESEAAHQRMPDN